MSNKLAHRSDPVQPMIYQIKIKGHLNDQWTDWFEGLSITLEKDGNTLLSGPVIDQAALHGLLKKVRDLGMPLVSVSQVQLHSKKEKEMNTNRKTAVLVGILFIVGTVSGILSGAYIAPIRAEAAFPLNVNASETPWIIGTLFVLLMGLSLAMVPVLLYPILRKRNEVLALGSVLFRGVFEAICETLLAISFFLLLTASEIYGKTGATDVQSLASLLIASGEWIQIIGGIVFSVGTLMIFILLYQTRLIPRWLSGWGVIGAVLYFVAKIVSIFGPLHTAPLIESGIGQLMIPTAIQEMVFAVWMIVKGFNPSAITALSAK